MEIMDLDNPRWEKFISRLAGEEGCNFRETDGKAVWDCNGDKNRPSTCAILADMGFTADQIASSLSYFESNGGYCDCEIILNVDR
jgi:hypothetical protein